MSTPRRPLAFAAATATATAALVCGTAFTALPAHAAEDGAAASSSQIVDGSLTWGVKESFRRYLTSPIADGKITVSDGAEQAADNGVFTFGDAKGTYDSPTHAASAAVKGSVRFEGHHGALDITLSDLKVDTTATSGTLTADVESNNNGEHSAEQDVPLADLALDGVTPGQGEDGSTVLADIPATLTAEGAEAFAGFYEEGAELDPATLAMTTAAGEDPGPADPSGGTTSGGSGGSSSTGSSTGSGSAGSTGGSSSAGGTSGTGGTEADTPSSGTAAEDGALVDGNLDWGVKESFRSYVTGPIASGRIELADGAAESGSVYRFSGADGSFDSADQKLSAGFQGSVRFLGHKESDGSYALDLKLSALAVTVADGKGTLAADVRAKDRTTHEVSTYDGLTLATLDLPEGDLAAKDGILTLSRTPAKLTADGAKAFGGFYEAGEALDPVTVNVSLDEDATLPGGDDGGSTGTAGASDTSGSSGSTAATVGGSGDSALASTGTPLPAAAVLAAAVVALLTGTATVVVSRRRTTTAPAPAHS
ncbi:HtaA domain-containing protein [Streptomyces daliensis]